MLNLLVQLINLLTKYIMLLAEHLLLPPQNQIFVFPPFMWSPILCASLSSVWKSAINLYHFINYNLFPYNHFNLLRATDISLQCDAEYE